MKILMLSRDEKIFEKGSTVRVRMVEYGTLFEELHVVVFTKRFKIYDLRFKNIKIGNNVWVYPTNSIGKLFYIFDAMRIAKKILATSYPSTTSASLRMATGHGKPPACAKAMAGRQATSWVVTSQDPFETGYIASKIAKKFGISLQLQIHTDFLSPYFRKESIKNFVRYVVSKIVLSKASCIRVVSERIKNSMLGTSDVPRDTRCPVITLPIFVDAQKIKNAQPVVLPKKFSFIVLWVGRLEKEKNCSLAIAAFAYVVKKIPNAGLIIVGDGSERKKLELQATNYKLQANVLFVGWKDNIAEYYKSADVLLVTSNYEGYGLNMVEARITSIPVVAPDVGVAREVGAYITEHTPESIAETLIQLHDGKLPKRAHYEYPYKDKSEYLELYKKSFEQCLM
ncbi:MAG: glycosyltransferase [Parcubacteria group bacterium]|nr:glycosyltransferase [Parcubacteria group bacterium]